jgi:DNA-directed RNA polymerase sigma subunit (sigma70/sigma32)
MSNYQPYHELPLTASEIARLKRRAEILAEGATRHESGATLAQIGDRFGITKQRVHQMLTDAGVPTYQRKSA